MVNITHKNTTLRKAIACATVRVSTQDTMTAIQNGNVPKGDIFSFAKVATLFGVKKTSELIPDCHPLPVEYTDVRYETDALSLHIYVEVHTIYRTGVEVEAMHGASIAALTMYDMLKPIDKGVVVENIRLVQKKGGKTNLRYEHAKTLKVGIVICSNSVSRGTSEDTTGIGIEEKLTTLGYPPSSREAIPDDVDTIRKKVETLQSNQTDLAIFAGGTGLSPLDVTPDAIAPLIERDIPGIMETARQYGQQRMPYAMLSRGVSGFVGDMLVLTVPGSPRGALESLDALLPQLFHVFKIKEGIKHN